jgi:hypothetical protein
LPQSHRDAQEATHRNLDIVAVRGCRGAIGSARGWIGQKTVLQELLLFGRQQMLSWCRPRRTLRFFGASSEDKEHLWPHFTYVLPHANSLARDC